MQYYMQNKSQGVILHGESKLTPILYGSNFALGTQYNFHHHEPH